MTPFVLSAIRLRYFFIAWSFKSAKDSERQNSPSEMRFALWEGSDIRRAGFNRVGSYSNLIR